MIADYIQTLQMATPAKALISTFCRNFPVTEPLLCMTYAVSAEHCAAEGCFSPLARVNPV